MKLNPTQWHARLYRWTIWQRWYFLQRRWQPVPPSPQHANVLVTTNLCHYIRTLILWFPLLIGLHLILLGAALYVLVIWPIKAVGFNNYGMTIAILDGAMVAFAAMVTGVIWSVQRVSVIQFRRHYPALQLKIPNPYPGFFKLLGHWIRDRHERICSTIELS